MCFRSGRGTVSVAGTRLYFSLGLGWSQRLSLSPEVSLGRDGGETLQQSFHLKCATEACQGGGTLCGTAEDLVAEV